MLRQPMNRVFQRIPVYRFGFRSTATITPSPPESNKHEQQVNLSVVSHPFDLRNGSKPLNIEQSSLFAVVALQGRQFKLTKDDVFVTDKLKGNKNVGDIVELEEVLLLGSEKGTIVGRPKVPGAKVKAVIEEKTKDKKVMILKYRRRKNSKRLRGFRRDVTVYRVTDVVPPSDLSGQL